MRQRLLRFLAAGTLLCAPVASYAGGEAVLQVVLEGTAVVRPWVTVSPLDSLDAIETHVDLADSRLDLRLPERRAVLLCAGAEDVATQCRRVVPGEETRTELTLDDGRRVTVTVYLGRAAVAGASVQLRPAAIESRRPITIPIARTKDGFVSATKTASDGVLTLDHLAPGDYVFELKVPGGAIHETDPITIPARRRNEPYGPVRLSPIRLPAGMDLTVVAVDGDGAPLQGVGVGVSQAAATGETGGDTRPLFFEGTTGGDGTVALTGLRDDLPASVTCSLAGHVRSNSRLDRVPRQATCVLERFASIRGVVTHDGDRPLGGVEVSLGSATVRTADDGAFRLMDVPPGRQQVRFAAAAAAGARRDVSVHAGEQLDLGTIELGPAATAAGTVVDAENGAPLSGARLAPLDAPGAPASTDDKGQFELTIDPAGATWRVSRDGYAETDVTLTTASDQVVRLTRPGTLEVTVWEDSGAPCVGCTVTADARRMRSGLTDASGIVRFQGLEPGTYYVTRERVRTGASYVTVSGGDGRPVQILSGRTSRLQLGAPSKPLRVYLSPLPDASWRLLAESRQHTTTVSPDTTSAYVIRRDRGEEAALVLLAGERGVRLGTIPAEYEGEIFNLNLSTASADVTLVAGDAPVPGVMVQLRTPDGAVEAWGRTDGLGTVHLPFVRPGEYLITTSGVTVPLTVPSRGIATKVVTL